MRIRDTINNGNLSVSGDYTCMFCEIMIGKDFTYEEILYQKCSYDSAMPISITGNEKTFRWNDIVIRD